MIINDQNVDDSKYNNNSNNDNDNDNDDNDNDNNNSNNNNNVDDDEDDDDSSNAFQLMMSQVCAGKVLSLQSSPSCAPLLEWTPANSHLNDTLKLKSFGVQLCAKSYN